jgi:hypothetical protein
MADDRLALAIPRISKFLLMIFSPSASDGEWEAAYGALTRTLKEVDPGAHGLVERITSATTIEDNIRKAFAAGYQKRIADEAAQRQRNAVALTTRADISLGDGVNGYEWEEIIIFCAANKARIGNAWEADVFIESIAEQLARSYSGNVPSEKQKPILRRIFLRWFNGQII